MNVSLGLLIYIAIIVTLIFLIGGDILGQGAR